MSAASALTSGRLAGFDAMMGQPNRSPLPRGPPAGRTPPQRWEGEAERLLKERRDLALHQASQPLHFDARLSPAGAWKTGGTAPPRRRGRHRPQRGVRPGEQALSKLRRQLHDRAVATPFADEMNLGASTTAISPTATSFEPVRQFGGSVSLQCWRQVREFRWPAGNGRHGRNRCRRTLLSIRSLLARMSDQRAHPGRE